MKATIKNVSVNDHNEDLINFAQTIDFSELFDHIKKFTGVTCSFYQPEITTSRGSVYISFMSDDITSQTGPFAAILERCYLHSFSNGVFKDKDSGELGYWVSVDIRYEHKDGGSNGMHITRASYTERTGWVFCDAGERK